MTCEYSHVFLKIEEKYDLHVSLSASRLQKWNWLHGCYIYRVMWLARHYKKKNCIRLKAPDYLLLGLFQWFIFRIHKLSNNKWFITVKSMPVSNMMMVESLLFGLISKFEMYTGLGKILLSKIITLSIRSWWCLSAWRGYKCHKYTYGTFIDLWIYWSSNKQETW